MAWGRKQAKIEVTQPQVQSGTIHGQCAADSVLEESPTLPPVAVSATAAPAAGFTSASSTVRAVVDT